MNCCIFIQVSGEATNRMTNLFLDCQMGKLLNLLEFNLNLKNFIKFAGFNEKLYSSHSLRFGRSCDLYKLGLSVETIKKIGSWRSDSVYRYLKL